MSRSERQEDTRMRRRELDLNPAVQQLGLSRDRQRARWFDIGRSIKTACQCVVMLFSTVGQAQPLAPSVLPSGIVNTATFRNISSTTPAVARGSLISVFGNNLSTQTIAAPPGSPLPVQMPGNQTVVLIANIAAPLLYISSTQINLQVPYELPDSLTGVEITVQNEYGR